ncbi:MAG: hypothetical protein QOI44_2663, partial [Actinomycetota bacterium]|nr:hypothetical protein [Actinomycetota bacterium]
MIALVLAIAGVTLVGIAIRAQR